MNDKALEALGKEVYTVFFDGNPEDEWEHLAPETHQLWISAAKYAFDKGVEYANIDPGASHHE